MRRHPEQNTSAVESRVGNFQLRLRRGLMVSALAVGIFQLGAVTAAAQQFTRNQQHRDVLTTSTKTTFVQLQASLKPMAIGAGNLADIRGRGANPAALSVPGGTGPSIVLWDEGLRPVTTSNTGTSGNLQSNVINGVSR